MWCVAPESKIQLVNCELSPKFPLGHLSLLDMHVIYAYIFWSLLFMFLLSERLPCSLNCTCFHHFSLYFGVFGHFSIRWSSDQHLKHFRDVCSVLLFSEWLVTRDFYFSCLILLNFVFCRVISNSTKRALFLSIVCSLTISPKTWAAIKIEIISL